MSTCLKVIVEKRSDGYVAYPIGVKVVIVGQGATYEEALSDVRSAIQFHMEQNGLRRRDLEPYISDRARVADVLNRRRPLSLSMIRRLHAGLGIPSDLLIKPYRLTTSGAGRARDR